MLAFDYSANAYFAEQLTERLNTTSYSLEDVLSKTVDHYNSMKQIGPTKCEAPADKQNDGKDTKKKGDKPGVANPAIKDSAASSEQCQLCSLDHNAMECPLFQELKKQRAIKQGELFPSKSDKDGKRRGARASQNLDSSEETGDEPHKQFANCNRPNSRANIPTS
jgi:hypothetical protein